MAPLLAVACLTFLLCVSRASLATQTYGDSNDQPKPSVSTHRECSWPDSARADPPAVDSDCRDARTQDDADTSQDFSSPVQRIVETYRRVTNYHARLHRQSWMRLVAGEMDFRTKRQVHQDQKDDFARLLQKYPFLQDTKEQVWSNYEFYNGPGTIDDLIMDEEYHIDEYFDILMRRCQPLDESRDPAKPPTIVEECFGSIANLVSAPRCTVRMDSRYRCRTVTAEDDPEAPQFDGQLLLPDISADELIRQHFTDTTLNIVVIGAGPAGLHFANVMTRLQEQREKELRLQEEEEEGDDDDTGAPDGTELFSNMRVLVFENRTMVSGRKMRYGRNWVTDVPLNVFESGDPRIVDIFKLIHANPSDRPDDADLNGDSDYYAYTDSDEAEDADENLEEYYGEDEGRYEYGGTEEDYEEYGGTEEDYEEYAGEEAYAYDYEYGDDGDDGDDGTKRKVRLPIMVLETFLLLSARSRGVKFLYEDFRQHKQLLRSIPNLIVIDASGHRLDLVDRDDLVQASSSSSSAANASREDSSPNNATISPWDMDEVCNTEVYPDHCVWNHVDEEQYEVLRQHHHIIHVAKRETKQGAVYYPVSQDNRPFVMRFLQLQGYDFDGKEQLFLKEWAAHAGSLMTSKHPMCRYSICSIDAMSGCTDFCRLASLSVSADGYRQDIRNDLDTQPTILARTTALLSLTAEQFDAFCYILTGHSKEASEHVLLYDINVEFMVRQTLFMTNNLVHALRFFSYWATSEMPLVSLFTYAPFIYDDPLVPMSAKTEGRIGGAPLLRIGDSFLQGRPDLGSELNYHLRVIDHLAQLLRAEEE